MFLHFLFLSWLLLNSALSKYFLFLNFYSQRRGKQEEKKLLVSSMSFLTLSSPTKSYSPPKKNEKRPPIDLMELPGKEKNKETVENEIK